jgi:hypothetical protein
MDFDTETTSSGQDMSYYANERKSVFENYKQQALPVNTTLTCKSAKVWAFYHEHPHLDFEKMNVMFTDILVSIMNTTNPENNCNITPQILNGIANIQSQLTSQQVEYDKQLLLKLTEFKKEYIDDLLQDYSNTNVSYYIYPCFKDIRILGLYKNN